MEFPLTPEEIEAVNEFNAQILEGHQQKLGCIKAYARIRKIKGNVGFDESRMVIIVPDPPETPQEPTQ